MEHTCKRIWFPAATIRLRVLENVFVAEEGLVLRRDLGVEQPTIRQHAAAQIEAAREAVSACLVTGEVTRLDGDVVLCRRPGTVNYGHWLVEMLPQAYIAAQHWPHPARFMVQRVEEPLAAIMRQTLARLGISDDLCIEAGYAPVLVERLILVEGLTDHGSYVSPFVFDCLDRLTSGIPPGPDRHVYVSRGSVSTRRLVDEDGIMTRAAARGFRIALPGSMSFAEQVAVFKGATRIVGVMGASLSNLVFTPPGADVYMLAPANMPDTFFWFCCGYRRIRLIDVRCRNATALIGCAPWDGELTLDEADEAIIFGHGEDNPYPQGPEISALFDPDYYVASCGNEVSATEDPLAHYCTIGWKQGLDPSALFSTRRYLREYEDVAAAGMNPLLHYIEHGRPERRAIFPAGDTPT